MNARELTAAVELLAEVLESKDGNCLGTNALACSLIRYGLSIVPASRLTLAEHLERIAYEQERRVMATQSDQVRAAEFEAHERKKRAEGFIATDEEAPDTVRNTTNEVRND
jgi:hypothetical protein